MKRKKLLNVKEMEELKNNQEVSVENISTFVDWLDDTYISIVVRIIQIK